MAEVAVTTLVNLDKGRQSRAKAHPLQDRAGREKGFLGVQRDQVTECRRRGGGGAVRQKSHPRISDCSAGLIHARYLST